MVCLAKVNLSKYLENATHLSETIWMNRQHSGKNDSFYLWVNCPFKVVGLGLLEANHHHGLSSGRANHRDGSALPTFPVELYHECDSGRESRCTDISQARSLTNSSDVIVLSWLHLFLSLIFYSPIFPDLPTPELSHTC